MNNHISIRRNSAVCESYDVAISNLKNQIENLKDGELIAISYYSDTDKINYLLGIYNEETNQIVVLNFNDGNSSTIDLSDYYTKTDVDSKLSEKLDSSAYTEVDLSRYAKKDEIPTIPEFRTINGSAITGDTSDIVISTSTVDLSDYYNKTEIDSKLSNISTGSSSSTVDLSDYYTKEEADDAHILKDDAYTMDDTDFLINCVYDVLGTTNGKIKLIDSGGTETEYTLSDLPTNGKRMKLTGNTHSDEYKEIISAITNTVKIVIGRGVKQIPSATDDTEGYFAYYSNLETVVLPNDLTQIGDYAFSQDEKIERMNLPESLYYYGVSNAVRSFSGRTTFIVPKDVNSLGSVPMSTKKIIFKGNPKYYLKYCFNRNDIEEIEIPSGALTFGMYAFYNCSSLKKLILPNTITSFYNTSMSTFFNCYNLTDVEYLGTMAEFQNITNYNSFYACNNLKAIHCTDGDVTLSS